MGGKNVKTAMIAKHAANTRIFIAMIPFTISGLARLTSR
jgi:hypothetical protein